MVSESAAFCACLQQRQHKMQIIRHGNSCVKAAYKGKTQWVLQAAEQNKCAQAPLF